jgi:hypothetical protein
MSKWVTFSLAAVMVLGTAAMSLADVPSNLTSSVGCACVATAGGGASGALPLKCTLSPGGDVNSDDIDVNVVVRNVLGAPLMGSTVTATAIPLSGLVAAWKAGTNPQTGVSIVTGAVSFVFDRGGVDHPATAVYPNLDFSVTASGPGPGGPITLASCTPQLTVTGYDLDANGIVDLIDLILFAGEFTTSSTPAICDYDWAAGVDPVDLIDLILFASEFGATF